MSEPLSLDISNYYKSPAWLVSLMDMVMQMPKTYFFPQNENKGKGFCPSESTKFCSNDGKNIVIEINNFSKIFDEK